MPKEHIKIALKENDIPHAAAHAFRAALKPMPVLDQCG